MTLVQSIHQLCWWLISAGELDWPPLVGSPLPITFFHPQGLNPKPCLRGLSLWPLRPTTWWNLDAMIYMHHGKEKPIFDNMPTFTCIKLTNHIPSHNLSSKELLEQYNLVYQLWNKPAMFTHSKITSTQKKDVEEHYLKHHSYRYPKYYNADLCLYFYFFHFGLGEGRRAWHVQFINILLYYFGMSLHHKEKHHIKFYNCMYCHSK